MSARARELLRQLATFGLVGIAATAVHYFTALAVSFVLPLAYANPFGFLAAFGVSYIGHLRLTFRIDDQESNHGPRLMKFFAVAFAGFLVGQGALLGMLSRFPMLPEWLVLMLAVGIVPVTTFLVSRFWVFRKTSR